MLRSCGTCRSRRRACDKVRPTCGTCKKSGHLCVGYEAVETKVFVNFDSKNLNRRKKRVLCDAIRIQHEVATCSNEGGPSGENSLSSGYGTGSPEDIVTLGTENKKAHSNGINVFTDSDVRIALLGVLHMSTSAFHEHLSALWYHFQQGHTQTSFGWAPSFGALILTNRSLDLALVSLGALRLAQTGHDPKLRVMSHSAYEQSMRIFRRVCGTGSAGACKNSGLGPGPGTKSHEERRRSALLAVTSMCYSFYEASLSNPITFFTEGFVNHNMHMNGCMLFMQAAGPKIFAHGGAHRAFRKIREMACHTALSSHKPCIFASKVWMSEPWRHYGRSIRDQLFDIITQLTTLAAYALNEKPVPFLIPGQDRCDNKVKEEGSLTPGKLYLSLEKDFKEWMNKRLNPSILKPGIRDRKPILVDRHEINLDKNDVLLQTEARSTRLLMALVCMKLGEQKDDFPRSASSLAGERSSLTEGPFGYAASFSFDAPQARANAAVLAHEIREALKLPIFNLQGQLDEGIVEGQCRSILPSWCLIEYDRITQSKLNPYEMPLDGIMY